MICSEYSAGGAPSDAAYGAWINSLAKGLGNAKAVVILEPDALANLPTDCSAAYQAANPTITDATREADIANAVSVLEGDPNAAVYLDAGHSAWQNVGNISLPLVAAGVQKAQGFSVDVSNYQYASNNVYFGTWVSDCIAMGAGSLTYDYNDNCPNQDLEWGPVRDRDCHPPRLGDWRGAEPVRGVERHHDHGRPQHVGYRHPLRRHRWHHPLRHRHEPLRAGAQQHEPLLGRTLRPGLRA